MVLLCLVAIGGIVGLVWAESFCRWVRFEFGLDHDNTTTNVDNNRTNSGSSSPKNIAAFSPAVITLTFISFGISDICYDCLLIPGRALLDDLAVPLGQSDDANALFTGFQLIGRLLGLVVVSSTMTNSGLWGLFSGQDGHFKAVLSTTVLYLMATVVLVTCFVDDVGARPLKESIDNTTNDDDDDAFDDDESGETDDFISNYRDGLASNGDDNCLHDREKLHPTPNKTSYHPLSIESDKNCIETNHPSSCYQHAMQSICNPDPTTLLVLVQSTGWMGITSQSFFWTSWRGEQIGSIDLALQGAVGILTSAFLPAANRHFGAASVWLASELFFHVLMISVIFVDVESIMPRIISALCGINYAIHATNALIVAADVVADPSKRARTIASVNNALPFGQLVTALFGGIIAQYFGGFENVFVCFGGVGSVVTGAVWVASARRGLFKV